MFHTLKQAFAELHTKIPHGTVKKTTMSGRAWNDCIDTKYRDFTFSVFYDRCSDRFHLEFHMKACSMPHVFLPTVKGPSRMYSITRFLTSQNRPPIGKACTCSEAHSGHWSLCLTPSSASVYGCSSNKRRCNVTKKQFIFLVWKLAKNKIPGATLFWWHNYSGLLANTVVLTPLKLHGAPSVSSELIWSISNQWSFLHSEVSTTSTDRQQHVLCTLKDVV